MAMMLAAGCGSGGGDHADSDEGDSETALGSDDSDSLPSKDALAFVP
ncbi:MAG: hypothetical protein JXX29_02840 [Deltaproteobacteria bacterium]|nr:hypothetical protein [Deltaproteobacteria bacterium]MBN2670579.1 hypothetical protein [Deltaproteobacteria bacterium]